MKHCLVMRRNSDNVALTVNEGGADTLDQAIEIAKAKAAAGDTAGEDLVIYQAVRRVRAETTVKVEEVREPVKVAERNGNGHAKPDTQPAELPPA